MRQSTAVGARRAAAMGSALALVLAWVAGARAQPPAFDPEARYRVAVDGAPSRGPGDALVTVVEYSDFACPYCRRAQDTLNLLQTLYPEQVRVVFRHNPLDEEEGTLAAEASMAAHAHGLFWPMHDRIFDAGGVVTRSQLEGFALELGLDITEFRRALDERLYRAQVLRDAGDADALGIHSTPVFFVNGRPIRGALPLSVFVDRVEQELARAQEMVAAGVPAARVYAALMERARPRADADPFAADIDVPVLDESRTYPVGEGLPRHALGPRDALVTVVVFSDFQCPFCLRFLPVLYAIRDEYPDDVRIVFRHHPLDFHADAQLASEAAAAAAAQGKFWPMHDLLYQHQDRLGRADLERYAERAGLDMARFRAELDAHRYARAITLDRAIGSALGVAGTPTLFINGVPVRGARSYEVVKHVYLEPALERARILLANGVARADIYRTLLRASGQTPAWYRIAEPELQRAPGI